MASQGLQRYALFMAAATFFLVIAGGMVTSTGSALAVPDWPLSYGQFFPKMEGGIFYEHGHRMVAATIGFLTIILAFWLRRGAQDPWLRRAGWLALGIVCMQGVLGGVTVLLRLPTITSVGHACLGQLFFSLMCSIAVMANSPSPISGEGRGEGANPSSVLRSPSPEKGEGKPLRRLSFMTAGFVFLQLLLGAIFRHTGHLLYFHMAGAFLVFIHVTLLIKRIHASVSSDPWFSVPSKVLGGLVIWQIGLGIYTWQNPTVLDATAHVATGALILATTIVIALQSVRRLPA